MSHKVAISGAHGTGKTTLLRALTQSIPNISTLPEIPRILIELNDDPEQLRRGNNTLDRQLAIIAAQMAYEGQAVATGSVPLLTDRTVGDHWAYTVALFESELNRPSVRLTEQSVRRWLTTYDFIFFLSPEFPPEDDGVRESDVDFRDEIDGILKDLYTDAGVTTMSLTGTIEERSRQLRGHLDW